MLLQKPQPFQKQDLHLKLGFRTFLNGKAVKHRLRCALVSELSDGNRMPLRDARE